MHYLFVKNSPLKVCLLLFIALTAFTSSAKAGLDYYKIFIGKKLIYERYLNKPLSLQNLPISTANANETLTIYYYQCQTPRGVANNRSIALKDDNGNTIKQWSFADVQDNNTGMSIPVKELLQLQKAHKRQALALFYAADGRTGGEKLAALQPTSKAISYIQQEEKGLSQLVWQVVNMIFKNMVVV